MQKERDYSFHILLRGIILIGFFLLVFKLMLTGNIQNFIAPKMIPFSYFSIVVLLVLGVIQVWRSNSKNKVELYCNCGFDHNNNGSFFQSCFIYSLFILPILIGLWFPDIVLDSSIVAKRGVNYGSSLSTQASELNGETPFPSDDFGVINNVNALIENNDVSINNELQPYLNNEATVAYKNREELKNDLLSSSKIVVKDEYYLDILDIIANDLNSFIGKELDIVGFVYKEPDFNADQFVVARFAISCCVADSSVYGIVATTDISHPVVMDEWIRVRGIISRTNINDWDLPNLQITDIKRIDQPEDPYVYENYMP